MALDIRSDNGELFACIVQLMLADAAGDFEQVAFYQQQIAVRGWYISRKEPLKSRRRKPRSAAREAVAP